MNFGQKKRGFTLVEMLIVIVIIGVLAAALIPRLTSVRGRANDVARKADLQQVATAIVSYSMDKAAYPTIATDSGNLSSLSGLLKSYVTVLPSDPNSDATQFNEYGNAGNYAYGVITKGGTSSAGFFIMSKVETEGGANRIYYSTGSVGLLTGGSDSQKITPCTTMTYSAGSTGSISNGTCTYGNEKQLRYIIAR